MNKKILFSFLISLLILHIFTINKNENYINIKYETNSSGVAHIYINGDWINPIKSPKNSGISTVKFGPIDKNIKHIRFDPIDQSGNTITIYDINIESNKKESYSLDLNNTINWRYEHVKNIFYDKDSKSLKLSANGILPANIYIENIAPLDYSDLSQNIFGIHKLLSINNLFINLIVASLVVAIYYGFVKIINGISILNIVYSISWIAINIILFGFFSNDLFIIHENKVLSNGSYLGGSINSYLYSYISLLVVNGIFLKIISKNEKN
jgi:hypothetical protein